VILLVDIGNTRIKWCLLTAQGLNSMHAASHAGWDRDALRRDMLSAMARPERVLIANVGGDSIGRLLAETLTATWNIIPEFVHSTAQAAGVRNGYAIPVQMGVDRWLAVIGAFHLMRGSVCVVSVGTAMTVDGVDSQGLHLGGVIVPGPDLAIQSLLTNTSDLAVRAQSGEIGSSMFADNTLGAINQGVGHMLAALIERKFHEMHARLGASPTLLMTGGASNRIAPLLRIPFQQVPNLVLQGLALFAREQRITTP
jgi:type III pantothenate kinase